MKVLANSQYSKRITIPAAILKALGNPTSFELKIQDGKILLEPKKEEA